MRHLNRIMPVVTLALGILASRKSGQWIPLRSPDGKAVVGKLNLSNGRTKGL